MPDENVVNFGFVRLMSPPFVLSFTSSKYMQLTSIFQDTIRWRAIVSPALKASSIFSTYFLRQLCSRHMGLQNQPARILRPLGSRRISIGAHFAGHHRHNGTHCLSPRLPTSVHSGMNLVPEHSSVGVLLIALSLSIQVQRQWIPATPGHCGQAVPFYIAFSSLTLIFDMIT